jgi:hypothetical protein
VEEDREEGDVMRRHHRTKRGHAKTPTGYTHRQASANALQENVYRDGHLVGTVTLRGKRHWVWWLTYIPVGGHYHPRGEVRTMAGGIRKIVVADKPETRRHE